MDELKKLLYITTWKDPSSKLVYNSRLQNNTIYDKILSPSLMNQLHLYSTNYKLLDTLILPGSLRLF